MRHIRLVSTPRLERSDSIKLIVRHPIVDLGCIVYRFIPKRLWKIIRLHHTSNHLLEGSILPLGNTILLRCVRNRVLHLVTCIFIILNEIELDILTTIIKYKDLEFPFILVLNQGFKNLEDVKKFIL